MTPLAEYLFRSLKKAGVDCTFGIPGDFVLPLYAAQAEAGMETIVCTHEPNVGFAADAYARTRGLGVALTTFGAGGLNMVNPIAMAYAEHSPVLVISGAPEVEGRESDVQPHHLVKSYATQLRVFEEVTVASAVLDNPRTAATEIDRVLDAVQRHKRPGYLEIPRDMTQAPLAPSSFVAEYGESLAARAETLAEAVAEIRAVLKGAARPVLFAGVGIRRNALMDEVVRLAEGWGLPVVSSVLGKASFPETHPHYQGVFVGEVGSRTALEAIHNSDCVLGVGVIYSDVNIGFGTGAIPHGKLIMVGEQDTQVFHHHYRGLPMADVVRGLAVKPEGARVFNAPLVEPPREESALSAGSAASPLKTAEVIPAIQELEQSRYSFISDIGDAWFIGLEIKADIFLASGYYASMGFAVPGALGVARALPERRPFVLVGDGAFQMTGNELSTLVRLAIPAIIVVLNNSTYKMLEALDQPREYYKLTSWDYVGLAAALGCPGERVETASQLRAALGTAEREKGPYLIEAVLQPGDHAPIMDHIRAVYAAKRGG